MISITSVSGKIWLFAWNTLQPLISLCISLFHPRFKKDYINFWNYFFHLECTEFQMRRAQRWKNGKRTEQVGNKTVKRQTILKKNQLIPIVSCLNTVSIPVQKDSSAFTHVSFSVPEKTLYRIQSLENREMISQKPCKRSISGLGKHLDLSSGKCPFQGTIPICTFSHLLQNYLALSTFLKI